MKTRSCGGIKKSPDRNVPSSPLNAVGFDLNIEDVGRKISKLVTAASTKHPKTGAGDVVPRAYHGCHRIYVANEAAMAQQQDCKVP